MVNKLVKQNGMLCTILCSCIIRVYSPSMWSPNITLNLLIASKSAHPGNPILLIRVTIRPHLVIDTLEPAQLLDIGVSSQEPLKKQRANLIKPNLIKELHKLHEPKHTTEDIVVSDLDSLSIWIHRNNLDDQLPVVDQGSLEGPGVVYWVRGDRVLLREQVLLLTAEFFHVRLELGNFFGRG